MPDADHETLRRQLAEFGAHKPDCASRRCRRGTDEECGLVKVPGSVIWVHPICDCGWDEANPNKEE